jgi:type 1 glutamine amidotransferase
VRWDEDGIALLDVPVEGASPEFGYLASRYALRNYRLSLEYRWGTKRFPPRADALRDSGLLYHLTARDAVWPDGVECQIQEGETGDVFLLAGGMRAESPSRDGRTHDPAAPSRPLEGGGFRRAKTADTLAGWNRVELTARGAAADYRVNGEANNRLTNLRRADGSPIDEGRIALQLEGAEIRYRDVRVAPLGWPERHAPFRVLVFSKTTGFRHDSIAAGVAAIRGLGKGFGFEVEATEDAAAFTAAGLRPYRAVVFLNTTGDVLDEAQQRAFEGYVRGGGGYVGVHAASDTEYGWPWYGRLVGAWFASHPQPQTATVRLRAEAAPSVASLPRAWSRTDEWYNFRRAPEGVEVLAELDESSYQGGTMGAHPVVWQHAFDGGRAWYTAMGHTKESYTDPPFLLHLLGGIGYAAGI